MKKCLTKKNNKMIYGSTVLWNYRVLLYDKTYMEYVMESCSGTTVIAVQCLELQMGK